MPECPNAPRIHPRTWVRSGNSGATGGGVRRAGNAVPATQSGQLHHYYLQAMAVLGVVVIVLVTVSLSVR